MSESTFLVLPEATLKYSLAPIKAEPFYYSFYSGQKKSRQVREWIQRRKEKRKCMEGRGEGKEGKKLLFQPLNYVLKLLQEQPVLLLVHGA